jgi:hypothetical protein
MNPIALRTALLGLPLATLACGPSSDPASNAAVEGPLYVVATVVSTEDSDTGYLLTVPSLEPGTTFDLSNAVEVSPSLAYAKPGSSRFYSATMDDPTITRWQVDDQGTLVPEDDTIISFANLGIRHAWPLDPTQIYSDRKAYFTDDANRRIVVWNPESMEITGTIDLDIAAPGALVPMLSLTVRKDRVLVVVSWEEDYENGDWSRFGDHVQVFGIDPKTDTVVETSEDPRCNQLTWSFQTTDGTAYLSPMSWFAPIRAMLGEERGVEPCGVRIVPPDTSFDQGYRVELDALTGGRPTGNLFLVNDDVAFVRAWHEELVSPLDEDKANWADVLTEAGFLWWRWQLGDDEAHLVTGQEPGAGEVSGMLEVDGKRYLPRIKSDYSSTTLDELDPDGALVPTLTGPGEIFSVARVR